MLKAGVIGDRCRGCDMAEISFSDVQIQVFAVVGALVMFTLGWIVFGISK